MLSDHVVPPLQSKYSGGYAETRDARLPLAEDSHKEVTLCLLCQ